MPEIAVLLLPADTPNTPPGGECLGEAGLAEAIRRYQQLTPRQRLEEAIRRRE